MRPSLFPFAEAMRFGFGILHLSSCEFWAMTPRELRAAARAFQQKHSLQALTYAELHKLIEQFPDRSKTEVNPRAERIS